MFIPLSMPPQPPPRAQTSWRARILNSAFALLYGPLAGLHELAGRCMFGDAWHGRRLELLELLSPAGAVLDIGCGDGRLQAEILNAGKRAVGIDPSWSVIRRAAKKGAVVVVATGEELPFRDAVFDAVICSYPGPWITEAATWDELARVARPGASITVLLGGDYVRGRNARIRSLLGRLAYGRRDRPLPSNPAAMFGNDLIRGSLVERQDAWGLAYLWVGVRT